MKKLFTYIILGAMLVSACKKDEYTIKHPSVQKYAVTFKAKANFTSSYSPMGFAKLAAADDHEGTRLNNFLYVVYDSKTGEEVLRHRVTNGEAIDSLPNGEYTAVFVNNSSLIWTMNGQLPTFPDGEKFYKPLNEAYVHFLESALDPGVEVPDVFWGKSNFTVADHNTDNFGNLDRMVGKLVVNITNLQNLEDVIIYPDVEAFGMYLKDGSTFSQDGSSGQNFHYSGEPFYILKTENPFTVVLQGTDKDGEVRRQYIENVIVRKNQVTTLTGEWHAGDIRSDRFQVTYNPKWGTDTTKLNF